VVELAIRRFGGLDILVNNAAILRDGSVFSAEPRDFEAVIRNNLTAPFFLTRAAGAAMRAQAGAGRGGGAWSRIVNVVSTAGLYGNPGQAAYAAAKAGLVGLTRASAMDLAPAGVAVNAVAPFAATRVTEATGPANDAQATYKARALTVAPEHVARFVAFLAGDGGRDITGQLFGVRGREVFLFGQPRPTARIVNDGGAWDDAGLAQAVNAALRPAFTDLATDLEAFGSEPFV
jgi:NAD(P)-dependent dehydrogenase (short-subunit alcohol dehydrogenase family)